MLAGSLSPLARRLWVLFEPIHAVAYFSPEIPEADAALGLPGFWMSYFAGRSAPMGAVSAPVISATFFNFAPSMVERAIPDAWAFADPSSVLTTRLAAIDLALTRLWGDLVGSPELIEVAELARRAADACPLAGRPLAAAWASVVAGPDTHPSVSLWLALTVLREHRGDGHVAALVAEGLDGCEAHVVLAAAGAVSRAGQLAARGWTDADWDSAAERLVDRGWLAADGLGLLPAGIEGRRRIEDTTDRLALAPWAVLGPAATDRFEELLRPWSDAIVAAGEIRFPNPMGLPPAATV
jgi:hypothetical protein